MRNKAKEILDILIENHLTLSTAESCTGGRIASTITAVVGASKSFQGGIIAYQNNVKTRFLNVDEIIINKYDVVSKQVAEAMVVGACKLFATDYAIASTGYAGPDGGAENIPVGTIWLACGNNKKMLSTSICLGNNRLVNVDSATDKAIELMLKLLSEDIES